MSAPHDIPDADPAETAAAAEVAGESMHENIEGGAAPAEAPELPSSPWKPQEGGDTSSLLSPRLLSKFRTHQEEFVNSLEARLSTLLRLELTLKLVGLETISYKRWMADWSIPSCLTLFKLEPLRGVAVVEIPPRLGMGIVDRLLGGPGHVPAEIKEISEIERALLEQAVQIILSEWVRNWTRVKDLKPVLLGYESDGNFIQIAPNLTMLVISVETTLFEHTERFEIGIPFTGIQPLIAEVTGVMESVPVPTDLDSAPAPVQWKACFDEVPVPLTVERAGLELTAREVLNLKIGDLVPLDANTAERVDIRLGDLIKFHGRLGTVGQKWAVEITDAVKQ